MTVSSGNEQRAAEWLHEHYGQHTQPGSSRAQSLAALLDDAERRGRRGRDELRAAAQELLFEIEGTVSYGRRPSLRVRAFRLRTVLDATGRDEQ